MFKLSDYIELSYNNVSKNFVMAICNKLLSGLSLSEFESSINYLNVNSMTFCSDENFDLSSSSKNIQEFLENRFGVLFFGEIKKCLDEYKETIELLYSIKNAFSFSNEYFGNQDIIDLKNFLKKECKYLNYNVGISYSTLDNCWTVFHYVVEDNEKIIRIRYSKPTIQEAAVRFLCEVSENKYLKYLKTNV